MLNTAANGVYVQFNTVFLQYCIQQTSSIADLFDTDNTNNDNNTTTANTIDNNSTTVTSNDIMVGIDPLGTSAAWLYIAPHSNRIHRGLVLTGAQIPLLDNLLWSWILRQNELVFARTTPEQKLRLVQECQLRGDLLVN